MENVEEHENQLNTSYINHQKKLQRRFRLAFFGFLIIAFIPLINQRHRDFDVIINSALFMGIIIILFGFVVFQYTTLKTPKENVEHTDIKKLKKKHDLLDLPVFLITMFALLIVLNTFLISFTSVATRNSRSMEPTLNQGDDLLIYHLDETYDRFDIVVVHIENDIYFVKRLIGLPNETVKFENNELYIMPEGENAFIKIAESYLYDDSITCETTCVYELSDNDYFVLGDNRNNSTDSRDLGLFTHDDLYGKIVFRIRPFSNFGRIN